MITVPGSFELFVFFWSQGFALSAWTKIRNAALPAVCAVLACACVSFASADSSTTDTTAKKPPTTSAAYKHHKSTASTRTVSTGKRSRKKRVRGQLKIDSERAQAIQEALIREHYLKGEATGTWNEASEEAMRRYQADNGWQSKTVPDSRALIKLGLGPSKDHLLNPESAMTTVPDAPRAEPMPTTSHSASPATTPVSAPSSTQNDSPRPQ
jgi:peptidoglycan hydrolase-like protein with peptidoglycan-binding domain